MKPMHLFSPAFRVKEVLAEIRECLEKGWTGLGYKTIEFEQAWARYSGLPHAHFVNSGTAGLHLALKLLKEDGGWSEGGRGHHNPTDLRSYQPCDPVRKVNTGFRRY
jgi:dTDP-4-amino-4,6-dideoxygalactose transaminase